MRLVFFLFVFGNLAFFAWSQGYFGEPDGGREAVRLTRQIAPEKLRVVALGERSAKPACRLVTGLMPDAADSLKTALSGSGISVDIKLAEDTTRYWVHIPPQPSKAIAEKKAAELKKLGVKEFSIVLEDGPGRFALSLGLFKSESGAEEFLANLSKRGVKSARIEKRERPLQPARVMITGPADAVARRLPEQLAKLPDAKEANCQ